MLNPPDEYYRYDRPEMLPFVPSAARSLLEVGCGEGAFLGMLASERPEIVTRGIEINDAAATIGRDHGHDITAGAFPDVADRSTRFDVIMFNDVLEHIADPWAALEATRELLTPGGAVVVSLPNIRHLDTIHEIVVKGDFRYREEGVLDATHLRFFTMSSARRMFEETGYVVDAITGIKPLKPTKRRLPFFAAASVLAPSFRRESLFRQFVVQARTR